MPASSDIYGQIRQPEPVNVLSQLAQAMQVKGLQNQGELAQYGLKKAQREDDDNNALRSAVSGGADPYQSLINQGRIKEAGEYQKSKTDARKADSEIGKNDVETEHKAIGIYRDASQAITDPASAAQFVTMMHSDPRLKNSAIARVPLDQVLAQIPQDPSQLGAWKQQFALGATKYMELNKPTIHQVDSGGATTMYSAPGLGGAPTAIQTATKTATPGEVLTANTSRANNRDTIAKDYKVAGLDAQGNFAGFGGPVAAPAPGAPAPAGGVAAAPAGPLQGIIQSIGTYKAPENVAFARVPPAMRSQILAEVQRQYPDYDPSIYHSRRAASVSFATGKDGQSVQSANTALNHLGTLRELAAAQDNGDIRLFNTLANRFSTETGGAAPTNLAAAITMVGPEISKAVIGAGGGQGDREKVDAALAALTKGGKGQAAGTLATMEDLFGGRLTEAKRTYERTTGRKDFNDVLLSPAAQRVLAARSSQTAAPAPAPGAAAAPAGWTYLGTAKQ